MSTQRARAPNSPYADAFARLGPGAPSDYVVIVWPSAVVGAVAPRHRLYGPWRRLSASGAELGRPAAAVMIRQWVPRRNSAAPSAVDVFGAATSA
jgi:hypothetical protein